MHPPRRSQPQKTACRRCHARKVRCDSVLDQPCSGCHSAGIECVAYEKRRRNASRFPSRTTCARVLVPASQARPMSAAQEATSSEVVEASPVFGSEDTAFSVGHHEEDEGEDESISLEAAYTVADDGEMGEAAAALSSLQGSGTANSSNDNNHDNNVQRHLVEMLSQDDIDQRVMQKGVRVVFVGQEFSNINYLIRHRARNDLVFHFPADQIPRRYLGHHLDRIPKEAFYLPAPAIVDELLTAYFSLVNPSFPVLDETTFMRQYRSRDPNDPPSLLVLQAVLLVGAHVSRGDRPDRDELKSGFFGRAKMLFDARFEWNRDVVVQAALLLTWHSEGVEDVGANAYHWVSVAARTAFGLGMHRDCGPSTLVASDRRLWRRLWWLLVQLDVLVTLSYGRPAAINLDDADVPPLEPDDFAPLEVGGGSGASLVDVDFVMHHSSLCAIISRVLRERFGLHVPARAKKAALLRADQSLARWRSSLPVSLRSDTATAGQFERLPVSTATLHIHYNNFLILLHRPPPRPSESGGGWSSVQAEDIEICSSSASSLVSLFGSLRQRGELRCLGSFAVNALFTTLVQLSAEMRVRNPVLGANAQNRFDAALEVLRSLAEYWLSADMILRLFEDGSERLRQELRIGKTKGGGGGVAGGSHHHETAPEAPTGHGDFRHDFGHYQNYAMGHLDDRYTAPDFLAPTASPEDQVDWNDLYWANSGFLHTSPFGDLGMLGPT